jgi:hypothetical protein
MDIKSQLEQSLKTAMKAGDDVTRRTVRMALAAIRQVEIDKRIALDDSAVLSIIQKEIKTRRESVEEASRVNRVDIVAATQAEIKVLEAYLPTPLTVQELSTMVAAAVAEVNAASPADFGRVMKVLMPRLAGRATGDQAGRLVKERLQG